MIPFAEAGKEFEAVSSDEGFAVCELFVSTLCDKSGKAEKVANDAIKRAERKEQQVYFLCFHVPYWDTDEAKDEFAKKEYEVRQLKYLAVFRLRNRYTPQLVVNGEKEFAGTDESKTRREIRKAVNEEPEGKLAVRAKVKPMGVEVNYDIAESGPRTVVNFALVQYEAVRKDEGDDRGKKNYYVVQEFQPVLAAKDRRNSLLLVLPKGVKAEDTFLMAYTQDIKSREIFSAVKIDLGGGKD
jgi:hypothetical protein